MIPDLPKRPRQAEFEGRAFSVEEMRFLGAQSTLVSLTLKNCPIGDGHVRELCQLPRLIFLDLGGTQVTDAALEPLAKLPKLNFLILDRTQITGEGLRHFAGHPALKTLYLSETRVGDTTIALAAQIPKLGILRIVRTSVSFKGLLALAVHPTLKVVADEQFTPEQYAEFQATQRRHVRAGRAKPAVGPGADDVEEGRNVLLAFFNVMIAWQREMLAEGSRVFSPEREERRKELQMKCNAIFEQYCTPKPRLGGRPGALICGDPPDYEGATVVEAEPVSKQKLLFYTNEARGQQRRYLLIKSKGQWRVDHRERLSDGWNRDSLQRVGN